MRVDGRYTHNFTYIFFTCINTKDSNILSRYSISNVINYK